MSKKYDEPKYDEPAPVSEPAPAPKTGAGKWQVTLEHAATLVVEAKDEAEAWEKYKQQWGIIPSHPIGHAKIERLT